MKKFEQQAKNEMMRESTATVSTAIQYIMMKNGTKKIGPSDNVWH